IPARERTSVPQRCFPTSWEVARSNRKEVVPWSGWRVWQGDKVRSRNDCLCLLEVEADHVDECCGNCCEVCGRAVEGGYRAPSGGDQFVALGCFFPERVVQLQLAIGHYRASCLVVKLRRCTDSTRCADIGDTERSRSGVGGDLDDECLALFAGEGVDVGGVAVADGCVDDEVPGERDGRIRDPSLCDCDRQVVTARAEACREGVGLRLAEVGLGVVLSDEE